MLPPDTFELIKEFCGGDVIPTADHILHNGQLQALQIDVTESRWELFGWYFLLNRYPEYGLAVEWLHFSNDGGGSYGYLSPRLQELIQYFPNVRNIAFDSVYLVCENSISCGKVLFTLARTLEGLRLTAPLTPHWSIYCDPLDACRRLSYFEINGMTFESQTSTWHLDDMFSNLRNLRVFVMENCSIRQPCDETVGYAISRVANGRTLKELRFRDNIVEGQRTLAGLAELIEIHSTTLTSLVMTGIQTITTETLDVLWNSMGKCGGYRRSDDDFQELIFSNNNLRDGDLELMYSAGFEDEEDINMYFYNPLYLIHELDLSRNNFTASSVAELLRTLNHDDCKIMNLNLSHHAFSLNERMQLQSLAQEQCSWIRICW